VILEVIISIAYRVKSQHGAAATRSPRTPAGRLQEMRMLVDLTHPDAGNECSGSIGTQNSEAIVEANVEGGDAVSEPADRDQVDTASGDGTCRRRRNPA